MCPYMKCNCPYFMQGQCPYAYNPYYQYNMPSDNMQRIEDTDEEFEDAEEAVNPEGVYMPAPFSLQDENIPDMHGNINIPKGPPPMHETPPKPHGPSTKAVDPGAIKHCKYKYVYIWPRRGRGFWAYLTYVGRTSIAGFRWNGRKWVYFGMDLRQIESFQCH